MSAQPAQDDDQYVVITRYAAPNGNVVVHAYGATDHAHARRQRRQALREAEGYEGHLEVSVCKLLWI